MKTTIAGHRFLMVVCGCVLFAASCDSDYVVPEPAPNNDVSYSGEIQPLFNLYCVTGCHDNTGGKPPKLEPQVSYNNLLTGKSVYCTTAEYSYIVIANPPASYLYLKLTNSQPCGSVMPPTGSLSSADIGKVLLWIEQGANNN